MLKNGASGDDVRKLQIRLGIISTGNFGPVTETGVKEWQKGNNLDPTGIIDDHAWNLLFPPLGAESSSPVGLGFNIEKIRGLIPDAVLNQIPMTARAFGITSGLRLSHFLAQCAHESGNFVATFENLNYASGRLREVFPAYFPGNLSDAYAHNPQKIGSRVYGNRMGNGDEASGEGYTYRGRGYIQLTGKNNYKSFAAFIGADTVSNPDLVATRYPLASAAFYFSSNRIWPVCDKGSTVEVITAVTKMINKGLRGLDDRIRRFNAFYSKLM